MSPDLTGDLSRLKVELKALGGVLDALSHAVRRAHLEGLFDLWEAIETSEAAIPAEHLVSYA